MVWLQGWAPLRREEGSCTQPFHLGKRASRCTWATQQTVHAQCTRLQLWPAGARTPAQHRHCCSALGAGARTGSARAHHWAREVAAALSLIHLPGGRHRGTGLSRQACALCSFAREPGKSKWGQGLGQALLCPLLLSRGSRKPGVQGGAGDPLPLLLRGLAKKAQRRRIAQTAACRHVSLLPLPHKESKVCWPPACEVLFPPLSRSDQIQTCGANCPFLELVGDGKPLAPAACLLRCSCKVRSITGLPRCLG